MAQNAPAPRRIIVGIDSSDNAARAADWAAREAADRVLPLHLVHALGLPGPLGLVIQPHDYAAAQVTAGERLLRRRAADLREQHPNLTVSTERAVCALSSSFCVALTWA